jgi:hypothetical protein
MRIKELSDENLRFEIVFQCSISTRNCTGIPQSYLDRHDAELKRCGRARWEKCIENAKTTLSRQI